MSRLSQYMASIVVILGIAGLAIGVVFIVQGVTKANWMGDAMRIEKVTVGLDEEAIASGEVVDSLTEAQAAGDVIREHRRGIAPTYNDLLAGGRYDPTNPDHLTYAQALNMENYLYLGVLGFGVTQMLIGSGIFMILMGIALVAIGGLMFFRLARRST